MSSLLRITITSFGTFLITAFCASANLLAQTATSSSLLSGTRAPHASATLMHEGDDDPGYSLYKSGYGMVLNERWDEARSLFQELEETFPESEYCDDALYWTGYSQFQSNQPDAAMQAYTRLIHEFPGSQYYDDAIADLTETQTRIEIEGLSRELERSGSMEGHLMSQHMRDVERQLKRLTWSRNAFPGAEYSETDPETQLRVDALNALNPDANDGASFVTLKEVALDQSNPVVLRTQAVHVLSEADVDLCLPVLVTLAKEDTNESLRLLSLDYLAQVPGEKSVGALIDVFQQIPQEQGELSAHVFYTIAAVGNDQAVDFLSKVARTHSDMTLRREAVFYLGSIGSEKSRTALQTILKGK